MPGCAALSRPDVGVAVFAHPDDDVTIGPLLAHYASRGVPMYVICVTSGQQGVAHTTLPAGPELAAVRERELIAACQAYGIKPPFLLREQDGQLAECGAEREAVAKRRIREILEEVKATVVITFGPEGYTGHPDHIAVGGWVTDLIREWRLEGDGAPPPDRLYYVMCPTSRWNALPEELKWFVPVDDAEASIIADCADGLDATCAAIDEYKSQFPAEMMAVVKAAMRDVLQGQVYLRLGLAKRGDTPRGVFLAPQP